MGKSGSLLGVLLAGVGMSLALTACKTPATVENGSEQAEWSGEQKESGEDEEKGYDLPVSEGDQETLDTDCNELFKMLSQALNGSDAGTDTGTAITEEEAEKLMDILAANQRVVWSDTFHLNMENAEKAEEFLQSLQQGKSAEIVFYDVHNDGGIGRRLFRFDGENLYSLYANLSWDESGALAVTSSFYNRVENWEYTKKGWFIYELCEPQPPEVTEVVNGNGMIRVEPQSEAYRELEENYLCPVGYQGNNLFSTDWNASNMENLDYNGLFDSFYKIKNHKSVVVDTYTAGVDAEEFEALLTCYLPVTEQALREDAVYEEETGRYSWSRIGCGNYSPSDFGSSYPEITEMVENEDGTVSLTVDAVCSPAGSDALITHVLTVVFTEDGGIRFLGNQITEGKNQIPDYQYRVSGD